MIFALQNDHVYLGTCFDEKLGCSRLIVCVKSDAVPSIFQVFPFEKKTKKESH